MWLGWGGAGTFARETPQGIDFLYALTNLGGEFFSTAFS
jgi:hypothetical protein